MKKVYYCIHNSYDCFDYEGNRKQNEIVRLGNNPIEAIQAWRKLKSHDYDYGDSYDETREIRWFFEEEKSSNGTNEHHFYTKPNDRIRKIKVIGWDDTVIGTIKSTTNQLLKDKELEEYGWYYNDLKDVIENVPVEYEFTKYIFNKNETFNIDDEDILI